MSVVPLRAARPSRSRQLGRSCMQPAVELANAVANTDFVPKALRDNPAAITAAILYGDEVGLGPMQSLARIASSTAARRWPPKRSAPSSSPPGTTLWIEESIDHALHRRRPPPRLRPDQPRHLDHRRRQTRRTRRQAKTGGQYPRAMLLARASAELARAVFADVIGGLAATEELDDTDTPTAPVAALPPAPDGPAETKPTTRRRRARTTPAATVSAPSAAPAEPELPPLPGEPEPEPAKPSEPALRKMFVLFSELGMRDRDARLAWASRELGRELESAAQLTDAETSHLIDALLVAVDEARGEEPGA